MSTCQKEHWNACCCTCANHLKDFSHPCTDGQSIMNQRGWICAAPELGGMFSGWTEHGMCEMHQPVAPADDNPLTTTELDSQKTENVDDKACRYPLCQSEAEQARIADEVTRAFFTGDPEPVCCWKCAAGKPVLQMVLCPTCGNKRCPKASDHTLECSGSNEPGQPGSVY